MPGHRNVRLASLLKVPTSFSNLGVPKCALHILPVLNCAGSGTWAVFLLVLFTQFL